MAAAATFAVASGSGFEDGVVDEVVGIDEVPLPLRMPLTVCGGDTALATPRGGGSDKEDEFTTGKDGDFTSRELDLAAALLFVGIVDGDVAAPVRLPFIVVIVDATGCCRMDEDDVVEGGISPTVVRKDPS